MTLQSGQVVDLAQLASQVQANGGGCCLPRSILGDMTPIVRMDGSGGKYWVAADPNCGEQEGGGG